MVYKRYIKRGGKKFGPYYYESYRDDEGISRTRKVTAPKKNSKKILIFSILSLIIVSIFLISLNSNFNMNSNVISKSEAIPNSLSKVSEEKNVVEKVSDKISEKIKFIFTGFAVEEGEETIQETSEPEINLDEEQNSEEIVEEEIPEETIKETTEVSEELPQVTEVEGIENEKIPEQGLEEEQIPEESQEEQSIEEIPESSNESSNEIIQEDVNYSVEETDEVQEEINESSEEIPEQNNTEVSVDDSETEDSPNDSSLIEEQEIEQEIIETNETEIIENETISNFTEQEQIEVNVTQINQTKINITDVMERISNISTEQYGAVLGKPVKWEKEIKVKDNITKLEIPLPSSAGNISVRKIEKTGEEKELEIKTSNEKEIEEKEPVVQITGGVIKKTFRSFLTMTGNVVNIVESNEDVVVEIDEELKEEDTIKIEYFTEPPHSEEKLIGLNKKEIKVIGPDEIHYENILAFSELPFEVVDKNNVGFYWNVNESRVSSDFELYDYDENGLYDYISWVVPHLSEQNYELEIKILNVQSYPRVGGIWKVEFTTIGNANLTISAVDGTSWNNETSEEDLKFLNIKCGDEVLSYEWIGNSVFIENYGCNETASESSLVLTEGKHTLKFQFGDETAYAYNDATTSDIPQTLNLHGKLTDENGTALSGNYNMTFKIYYTYSGGSSVWQLTNQNVSVDSEGVYHFILTGVNASFQNATYLGISVGNDAEMSPRINLTSTPYSFRADTADTLNINNNYQIQNLTLAQKITFGLGEIIQNLVSGRVDVVGSLNVTGNVTATYFVGDGSFLTGISATGSYPTDVNLTSSTYNGSLIDGSNTGYNAGNSICNGEFSGSHLCTEFEVMSWFANEASPSVSGDAWINAGGPKYVPANIPVNDCNGWTHGVAGTYLGNYWHFNSTTGGDGRAINCGTALKLACCTY